MLYIIYIYYIYYYYPYSSVRQVVFFLWLLSLPLIFCSLKIIFLGVVFWSFVLLDFSELLGSVVRHLTLISGNPHNYCFKGFFYSFLLLWYFHYLLHFFVVVSWFLKIVWHFFTLCSLCFSVWEVSIEIIKLSNSFLSCVQPTKLITGILHFCYSILDL